MPDYVAYDLNTGRIINKFVSADQSIVAGLSNIIEVTRDEINNINKFHLVDNGRLRPMTQSEKDALLAEEAQSIVDQENARVMNLDDLIQHTDLSGITLGKIDQVIDNIGNLNDAKSFLKKLCRYIIKFIAR